MKKQTKPEIFLDHYLGTIGLWRKPIARDGYCLFRAVSEQLFKTQAYHTNLYEACRAVFMHFGKELEDEWDEVEVMEILSRMYRRDFVVYENVGQPPVKATDNNYKEEIVLCRIGEHQLDSVYPSAFQQDAAICQSIVYEILYRGVFKLDTELTEAVCLIRDQNKKKISYLSDRFDDLQLTISKKFQTCYRDRYTRKPIPPVPYRIAKALDPNIYRNVELDNWEEEKREQKKESPEYRERFATGDKCQVILEGEHFHGHIQNINTKDNSAIVFIEELGEKREVQISCLKTPSNHRYHWFTHRSHCSSQLKYHNPRRQDSISPPSLDSSGYYSNYSNCVPGLDNNNNLTNCNNPIEQGYSLGRAYSYTESSMTNTNSNFVTMDTTPAHNGMSTSTPAPKTNLNEVAPPGILQRYGPPTMPTQTGSMVPVPYMYNSMVPQTSPSYSCIYVPYLESIGVNDVNVNCLPSQDMGGKDLPELNTLRFFFNLGVENYRTVTCTGGQTWPAIEMSPGMMAGQMMTTTDQLNAANMCGQFTHPPPPLNSMPASMIHHNNQVNGAPVTNQNYSTQHAIGYHSPQSEGVYNKSSTSPTNNSPVSDKQKIGSEEMADCHDSGCDSDSVSNHDDSFKENDDKNKLETSTIALEQKIDNYLANSNNNVETSSICSTSDFQVPSTLRPKTKRKYFMYGNLKLVKPIKDIPPRFLSLLAESSAERKRCEGEPIIVPFLPPKPYHKFHNNNANNNHYQNVAQTGTVPAMNSFNPEAKCFVPGQSFNIHPSSSIIHDPSIVAYGGNYVNIPYQSLPNTATVPTHINGTSSHPNLSSGSNGVSHGNGVCNNSNSSSGDGSKLSMPTFSAGSACSAYPTGMQAPVYYTGPGAFNNAQCYIPAPVNGVPGSGNSFPIHPSQSYSMPPTVTQVPAVQTAQ